MVLGTVLPLLTELTITCMIDTTGISVAQVSRRPVQVLAHAVVCMHETQILMVLQGYVRIWHPLAHNQGQAFSRYQIASAIATHLVRGDRQGVRNGITVIVHELLHGSRVVVAGR